MKLDLSGADSLRWMSPDATEYRCTKCDEQFECEEAAIQCFGGEELIQCPFCGSDELDDVFPEDAYSPELDDEPTWNSPPF